MANEKVVLEIDPSNIKTVSEEQSKKKKFVYKDPYWSNKEAKHMIVTINYPNGTRATASIQDNDGSNPDYKRIMEEFGEEQIDANTEEGLKRRDENKKKRMQRMESQAARARQDAMRGI